MPKSICSYKNSLVTFCILLEHKNESKTIKVTWYLCKMLNHTLLIIDCRGIGGVVVVTYASWIYNYLWNQRLSPLTLWNQNPLMRGVLNTTSCDQVCHWLATGFIRVLRCRPPWFKWNIVESDVWHHSPPPPPNQNVFPSCIFPRSGTTLAD